MSELPAAAGPPPIAIAVAAFEAALIARSPRTAANYRAALRRLAEFLPVDNALKQGWLALRDPLARLAAILEALRQLAQRAN